MICLCNGTKYIRNCSRIVPEKGIGSDTFANLHQQVKRAILEVNPCTPPKVFHTPTFTKQVPVVPLYFDRTECLFRYFRAIGGNPCTRLGMNCG